MDFADNARLENVRGIGTMGKNKKGCFFPDREDNFIRFPSKTKYNTDSSLTKRKKSLRDHRRNSNNSFM